jgi:hypothetical protein
MTSRTWTDMISLDQHFCLLCSKHTGIINSAELFTRNVTFFRLIDITQLLNIANAPRKNKFRRDVAKFKTPKFELNFKMDSLHNVNEKSIILAVNSMHQTVFIEI